MHEESGASSGDVLPPVANQLLGLAWILLFAGRWIVVQLLLAARRLRIALVLGGVFVVGSVVIRLAFRSGPVVDFGPAVLGLALAVAFLFVARDPVEGRG